MLPILLSELDAFNSLAYWLKVESPGLFIIVPCLSIALAVMVIALNLEILLIDDSRRLFWFFLRDLRLVLDICCFLSLRAELSDPFSSSSESDSSSLSYFFYNSMPKRSMNCAFS